MDRIGLTFEEYAQLKVRPRVGADAAFQHAAQMELERMFPMTLLAASSQKMALPNAPLAHVAQTSPSFA